MTTKTAKQTAEQAKPPVAKLNIGLVSANIWARETDKGVFYAATFERRYKDGKGDWQSTHSYNADDLLGLSKLADLAHTKIAELRAADKAADDE